MERCNGALLPLGVGHGKMLIALLAPRALKAKRPVLVTDADLVDVVREVEIPKYARHFELPEWHAIISYNDLSNPRKPFLLEELDPDALVFDEGHGLKYRTSVRWKRVRACLRKRPHCRVVVLSGTLTDKSIKDYAHLAKICLREGSPLPQDYFALEEWAAALDANPLVPLGPGKLLELCDHPHEAAREAYHCRFTNTPGVVASEESALGTSLVIFARKPRVPKAVAAMLEELEETWWFRDEPVTDGLMFHRIANQLSMGFYYEQVWPHGKDREYVAARKCWASRLQQLLKRPRLGFDSEKLFEDGVEAGEIRLQPDDRELYETWKGVRNRPGPETRGVLIDDFVVRDAMRWASEAKSGIVWYRDRFIGELIANASGWPHFADGDGVGLALANSNDYPFIVVSANAHFKGHNLQGEDGKSGWSRNLLCGMAGALRTEQLIGRTHRPGQGADRVEYSVFQHTAALRRGFARVCKNARAMEEREGNRQKLCFATKIGFEEEE